MLNPNRWAPLTSSCGSSGPRSQPRAGTSVPTAPDPNKLHRTFDLESFCFLFPHTFPGLGCFQDSDICWVKEKNWGEQGACGQRRIPAVRGLCLWLPLLPAARAQRVPQAAARDI